MTGLERAFHHGSMKNTSKQFENLHWTDWHGVVQPVPPALRRVARAFIVLQEERHIADYDNVETLLSTAGAAFRDWLSVRSDPMAGISAVDGAG